jgi:hypothetical protein
MAKNTFKIGDEEKKGSSVFSKMEGMVNLEGLFEDGLPVKYLPKIMYVVVLIIFYIGNNHYAEKTIRKIDKTKIAVEDLRADYTTLKANYMFASKQSEVAKRVTSIGLKESMKPPYKIIIAKN